MTNKLYADTFSTAAEFVIVPILDSSTVLHLPRTVEDWSIFPFNFLNELSVSYQWLCFLSLFQVYILCIIAFFDSVKTDGGR